ncbi:hypothetical protein [Amycolatopsis speibonae]|uniref:Uncharacterized protein n=1 Tax=Amycolatopsis speibonae TaxID=1450224 RepID=A0ABV7P7F9_9PSEU
MTLNDEQATALAKILDPEIWATELNDQSTVGARYQWHERRQASLVYAENALEAGWRPPQTDDETEWGRQWPESGIVQSFPTREAAEEYDDVPPEHAFAGSRLVRRRLGPWEQVEQS